MELKNIFKDHEFFKDLEKNSGEDAVIKCFKTMKHVVYGFQDEIFKYGDTAYYFYLILKGSVGIKVPSPVEITWSYNVQLEGILIITASYLNRKNKKIERSSSL